MQTNNYIDKRNQQLFKALHLLIKIEKHEGNHVYSKITEKQLTIYIPQSGGSIQLVTHELLRAYLIKNGINITAVLKERLRHEPLLHWTLNENLMEQIGQELEHMKMLPIYLSMGFERELFDEKYYMPCCSPISVQLIECGLKKKIPASASIDLFIKKYFAMRCCINPDFVYKDYLQTLKLINEELYQVLERFYNKWTSADIASLAHSYRPLATEFIHELGLWAIKQVYTRERS